MMTFPQFQATRKECSDIETLLGFDLGGDVPIAGHVYDDTCYIEDVSIDPHRRCGGGYYLMLCQDEWTSHDRAMLERILWAEHYLTECVDNAVLNAKDGTLDDYINGVCASRGWEVDGDLFAALFSGRDEWPVQEAREVIVEQYAPLLKRYAAL